MRGTRIRRLVFCGAVIFVTMGTLAGCGTEARSISPPTLSGVPTHQCSSWNHKSTAYLVKYSYGPGYIVDNDVWNPERIAQTLYSCNFDSFYVSANVQNEDGAVQSYPSAQYTFASPVKVSKFTSLTSDFRVSDPPTGSGLDYEFAYDIWFNGYGGGQHTEMMIWTYTDGRRPSGSELPGFVDFGGHRFEVWVSGGGGYLVTFVAMDNYTAGHTDLLPFFSYAASHGWLDHAMSTPLWQIDYGVELSGAPVNTRFDFTDFNVLFKT